MSAAEQAAGAQATTTTDAKSEIDTLIGMTRPQDDREKQRSQDGDDCDDDQKLGQRETSSVGSHRFPHGSPKAAVPLVERSQT